MNSLCRLCATYIQPNELVTDLSDLQTKLMVCYEWKPSEMEMQMPKMACNHCAEELQRMELQRWNFVERIRVAETKLNKILSEHSATHQFDEHQHLDVKVDIDAEQTDSFGVIDMKYNADNVDDHVDEVDFDAPFDNNDDETNVFGEPVSYANTGRRKRASKSNKNSNSDQKNDPFLSTLTAEDFLDDGSISCAGIEKLTKLYPIMKTMSWNECQYKCTQCNNRILKGAQILYAHVRSIHVNSLMSMKISCFYCKFKHRREYILNQHVATEHFAHLKFL